MLSSKQASKQAVKGGDMFENIRQRFRGERADSQEAAPAAVPNDPRTVRGDNMAETFLPPFWRFMLDVNATGLMLYQSSGIAARLVDMPASDAVAAGFDFEDDTADEKLREIGAYQAVVDGTKWARATGAGAILVIADDGRNLNEPLGKVRAIVRLITLDADQISDSGQPTYTNARQANFGDAMQYQVTINGRVVIVHESRLVKIHGHNRPPSLAAAGGLSWRGVSEIERNEKALLKYDDALAMVVGMLERKQQPVFKMAGLADAMQLGQEGRALVRRRVDTLDEIRGFRHIIAIDGGDDFTAVDLNMTGVDSNIKLLRENLCASSGIPVSILFGASASGLATTNVADQDMYARYIHKVQQLDTLPALKALLVMLGLSDQLEPHPVFVPTEAEEADIEEKEANAALKYAQAAQTMVTTGLISEREARAWVADEAEVPINGEQ